MKYKELKKKKKYTKVRIDNEDCLQLDLGKVNLVIRFSVEKDTILNDIQQSLTESFEERIRGVANEESIYAI